MLASARLWTSRNCEAFALPEEHIDLTFGPVRFQPRFPFFKFPSTAEYAAAAIPLDPVKLDFRRGGSAFAPVNRCFRLPQNSKPTSPIFSAISVQSSPNPSARDFARQ
jgi:hypothetical protein